MTVPQAPLPEIPGNTEKSGLWCKYLDKKKERRINKMVFSKLFFVYLFLPLCLLIYALARGTSHKNAVLIVFSLIFYAWGEPVYIVLMVMSAIVNFAAGKGIENHRGKKSEKVIAASAVIYDLLMLGIFKYSGFVAENINAFFSLSLPVPDIRLPIGISFYT
ncbi:MAG TPA: hypothetical protein DCZ71_07125, partial [Ruminococcus sp.]|nr:hypothetical protein [Ruminococcus sp.]